MRLIGSSIAIGLEKTNLFGMSFYGDGIQGQHARFRSDRSLDFFFQRCLIRVQVVRINF